MTVFTIQRTTKTEGSVLNPGNLNLHARATLIRLPCLLYVPGLRHLNSYFPLTNTDYCIIKTLIKDTARTYYDEASAPCF